MNGHVIAASRYRQLRLVCTQETSGRVSYSVYAKGLNDSWSEHTLLVRASVGLPPVPLASTEDVLSLLVDVLKDQMLPGSVQ